MNKFLAAIACMAVVGTSPALAQEAPTGSRLGKRLISPGVAMTKRDRAVAAQEFARCVFDRRNGPALRLLEADTLAAAQTALATTGGEMNCFNSTMANDLVDTRLIHSPLDLLRGGIAEAALAKKRVEIGQLQPIALQQSRYVRPWFAATSRDAAVDEMAVCVADTNPAGVHALVQTEPETPRETAAFGGLSDNLGKCLVAGARLQANREALRAALADALYQRLRLPALSIVATAKPSAK